MDPNPNLWFLVVGGLLVAMALAGSVLKRLPLTGVHVLPGRRVRPRPGRPSGCSTADPVARRRPCWSG